MRIPLAIGGCGETTPSEPITAKQKILWPEVLDVGSALTVSLQGSSITAGSRFQGSSEEIADIKSLIEIKEVDMIPTTAGTAACPGHYGESEKL